MDADVKKFIEQNIKYIEDYNWEIVFQNWYNDAYGDMEQDQIRIDELNNALLEAGIVNLNQTLDARKAVMTEAIDESIDYWIDENEQGTWYGSYNYLDDLWMFDVELSSGLGLDRDVIKQLIYDVAMSKGLTKYNNKDAYYLKRLRK